MKQIRIAFALLGIFCGFFSTFAFAQNNARMLSGVNPQTGITYSFVAADATRLTTFTYSGPASTATLAPGNTFGFGAGNLFSVQNLGPSTLTVACSCLFFSSFGSTGTPSIVLSAGQGADIYSDGLNYSVQDGSGSGGGGGGGGAWSSLTAPVGPLSLNMVTYPTTFTFGDYGSSPNAGIFTFADNATSSSDTSTDVAISVPSGSYHNALNITLSSVAQFQICNTNGTFHSGITVVGNALPCASLTTSPVSKFWALSANTGDSGATFAATHSSYTGSIANIFSVRAANSAFWALTFCASASNSTLNCGSGNRVAGIRGDGYLLGTSAGFGATPPTICNFTNAVGCIGFQQGSVEGAGTSGQNYIRATSTGFNAMVGTSGPFIFCFATTCPLNQAKGFPTIGDANNFANAHGGGPIYVSAFCGGITTCPLLTDESYAIVAAFAASSGNTTYIIDDMCGVQYWSEQPFSGTNARGKFIFGSNCRHEIMVDGMSTVLIAKTGLFLEGQGLEGSTLSTTVHGTVIEACNVLVDICPNGGFQVQHGTITSTTVSGATMSIAITGTPFLTCSTTGVCAGDNAGDFNQVANGRLLCIQIPTSPTANNANCWTYRTTTTTVTNQVFVVNTISGTTTSCNSGCIASNPEFVYLDTPLMGIGPLTGNQGGTYHSGWADLSLDCHWVMGCGGFVQAQGEEGTMIGHTQVWNAPAYGARLDQSSGYGGPTTGDTNSGPYGPWGINMRPITCRIVAGCPCDYVQEHTPPASGPGGTSATDALNCDSGTHLVPTGDEIGVGGFYDTTAGSAGRVADVIYPDPAWNSNWVGVLVTGLTGNQGTDRISHITTSLADQSAAHAGHSITEFIADGGAAQPIGIFVGGAAASFGHSHTEYSNIGIEVCGDVTYNATWEEEYGATVTGGVIFAGGFLAYGANIGTSIGVDIGQAGNAATCQDIDLQDMDIGNGNNTSVADNINGFTTKDTVVSYKLGHGTFPSQPPSVDTTATNILTHSGTFGFSAVATTAIATAGTPLKWDTAHANQVVTATSSDTGAGIIVGVLYAAVATGAVAQVVTQGIVPMTFDTNGTGNCAIGNWVIEGTTTSGDVQCASSYPSAGTIIGTAMAAQTTTHTKFNVQVGVK